jgi:hypoxanthine phosphoribosyltransferase
MEYYKVTWRAVEKAAEKLAEKIKQHEEYIFYDRIIPLGRGGLVPARLLAKYLDIKNITDMIGIFQKKWYSIPMFFNHAIIVDDIYDTGGTLNGLRTYKMTMEESLTCIYGVLYTKQGRFYDDRTYAGVELSQKNRTKWVIFPWEKGPDD